MGKDERKLVWKVDMFKMMKLFLATYGAETELEKEDAIADARGHEP